MPLLVAAIATLVARMVEQRSICNVRLEDAEVKERKHDRGRLVSR